MAHVDPLAVDFHRCWRRWPEQLLAHANPRHARSLGCPRTTHLYNPHARIRMLLQLFFRTLSSVSTRIVP